MNNIMTFDEHKAIIGFDAEKNLFRGEFIGLNGDVNFSADNIEQLQKNGQNALDDFLNRCEEDGLEPHMPISGAFTVNLSPALHEQATIAAALAGKTLDQWIADKISNH